MTRFSKTLSTLALVLPVLMFAGQAQAAMTGDQIKAAVSGKTLAFTGEFNGTANFATDGTSSMTLKAGEKNTGKWKIDGDKFCSQWSDWAEECATWTDEGGKYVTSNGYTMTPQ